MAPEEAKKKSFRKKVHFLLRSSTFKFCIIFPIFFVLIVNGTYFFEKGKSLKSLGDCYWYFFLAFVSGGVRFQAVTLPGRIFSIITIVVRMCLFGTVTAAIASFFMDSKNQKNRGFSQLKKLNHHFIICGWRPEMEVILDAVMESNPELTADQIVLVNNISSKEIGQLRGQARFKEINYVSGDYSHEDVLKRACVQTADRALVISDQSDGSARIEVDSRTILSVLTMKNMNPKIYVSAELFDAKLESHLKLAHCDEIILASEYEYRLLANASSGQGYTNIMHELISSNRESGIIVENIPAEYYGKTYGDFSAFLYLTEAKEKKMQLIGLLLNTGNFYKRRKDALRQAHKSANVEKIVDNLMKVKSIKSNKPLFMPDDSFVLDSSMKAIFIKSSQETAE